MSNVVLVLCYHAISPTWKATLSVTPEALERQLSLLMRQGWHSTTFSDAVLRPSAQRTLAVTFDDAFGSVFLHARPILSALGVPATVFAPTALMRDRQPLGWPGLDQWLATPSVDELISMDWNDLGELMDLGWEIGSHTRTHPHLTSLDDNDLRDELAQSLQDCAEHLGRPCESIAYPYGDVDARVADQARAVGYRAGASHTSGLRPRGIYRWPRMGIYHGDGQARFKLKLNPMVRRLRASPLWPRE